MAKEKTKVVTLELQTALSNRDLALEIESLLTAFQWAAVLTQKPRVQVAQQPTAKVSK